jgi:hypothetical protein
VETWPGLFRLAAELHLWRVLLSKEQERTRAIPMVRKVIDRLLGRDVPDEATATFRSLRALTPQAAENRYRAVSIWPGEPCCQGARQLSLMRFLCHKAPRLPLPECDQQECTCRYQHYSDRRSGVDRRRSEYGIPPPGVGERRSGRDRRRGGGPA